MVYINHEHRLIFIENPKSGSSSILKAFDILFGKNNKSFPHNIKKINELRMSPKSSHQTVEQVRKTVGETVWNSYLKVSTWRDPFSRFVSSSNFDIHQTRINLSSGDTNFKKYQTHLTNDISDGRFSRLTKTEWRMNCPFCIPQSAFTEGVDVLLRMEHLQSDFDLLAARFGIQSCVLKTVNQNTKEPIYTPDELVELYKIFLEE